tara:strand:- start:38 stop:433 length:396 start_codon:yes stop_codon:yes gene_type:complete
MQAMASFMEKAQSDPKLGEELVSLIDQNEREDIYPKVVSLAGEHGFSVTVKDVQETRQQFEQVDAGDGDLSDDDLENVSGGVASVVIAGLITGGAALGAAGIGAAGGVTAAVLKRGINNTVNDIGDFFKKW